MKHSKKFKQGIISLSLLFFMSLSGSVFGQSSSEKVLVEWQMLAEESQKVVDVFSRIIQCDNDTVIEFKVFNENSIDQNVSFDVLISSPMNSKNHTESFSMTIKAGDMHFPTCGTKNHAALAIKLPAGFNVSMPLQYSVIFK